MGIFGKHKGKGSAFEFHVRLHSIAPLPSSRHALVGVEWERGDKGGATASMGPAPVAGKPYSAVVLEETFTVPCTLYQVRLPKSGLGNSPGQNCGVSPIRVSLSLISQP